MRYRLAPFGFLATVVACMPTLSWESPLTLFSTSGSNDGKHFVLVSRILLYLASKSHRIFSRGWCASSSSMPHSVSVYWFALDDWYLTRFSEACFVVLCPRDFHLILQLVIRLTSPFKYLIKFYVCLRHTVVLVACHKKENTSSLWAVENGLKHLAPRNSYLDEYTITCRGRLCLPDLSAFLCLNIQSYLTD